MEFCSNFGYDYGYAGSDEEGDESGAIGGKKAGRRFRKADTNVVSIKFNELLQTNEMFAGEPIKCRNCEAVMTNYERKNYLAQTRVWKCGFCFNENDLSSVVEDQIPKQDDVTFLLEAAPKKTTNTVEASTSLDDNFLTYCIDISGSMDTQIETPSAANVSSTARSVHLSRLQGVKTAVVESLKNLNEHEPLKRVSLVTFSDEVKFYGDCTKIQSGNPLVSVGGGNRYNMFNYQQRRMPSQSQESNEDLLHNQEKLLALAKNQSGDLKPLSESYNQLESRVRSLHTEGSTALGPGLVFSIGFSSRRPGSQIILCTDGAANVGMGSIERDPSSEKFYEELADYALNQQVTIHVISMEGTDCKLALLGKVADKTNGRLNIVNPLNLSDEFKSILENRMVATNVRAKLIVNTKYLYIRDEDQDIAETKAIMEDQERGDEKTNKLDEVIKNRKSIITRQLGNVNIDTEITFEYGVRRLSEGEKREDLGEMAFQLQIFYTSPDGAQALRVYTKTQTFTKDRNTAEQNYNSRDILFTNVAQKVSSYALTNNVMVSKVRSKQMQSYRNRTDITEDACPEEFIQQERLVERLNDNLNLSSMDDQVATALYKGKKTQTKK